MKVFLEPTLWTVPLLRVLLLVSGTTTSHSLMQCKLTFLPFFFFFFAFPRAAPVAYGGLQARGLIGHWLMPEPQQRGI